MKNYIYPDEGDKLTSLFISLDSDEKYWAESEENVLNVVIERIKKLSDKPKFLDLGCGLGRLFSVFYPYVNTITGLEPDKQRFSEAKKEALKIDENKINVINDDISCIENEKYDAVLVSHVFQHIPFETIEDIFRKLSDIIPSEGILCITTTFTSEDEDIFSLEYLKRGKRISEIVSEKKFTKSFSKKGIVPVRAFSIKTMQNIFEKNNFILENKLAYHFDISLLKGKQNIEFDNKMNELGKLEGAKDILYILRRQ